MRVQVRVATIEDAPAIARIVIREACRHVRADCTDAGFRELLGSMTVRAVEARFREGCYRYWTATGGGKPAGACAMRGADHLYHLFVAREFRGIGAGRLLWEAARDHSLEQHPSLRRFTVNASTFAVPVYERFGFRADGGAMTGNGVRSWPMSLQLP